jgi:hypothetical protein
VGVRFHKSIRLLPFVRLNFSKSGISFSLGRPGASLNLGGKGARGSVGLPGTGLSYRKTLIGGKNRVWRMIRFLFWLGVALAVGLLAFARLKGAL